MNYIPKIPEKYLLGYDRKLPRSYNKSFNKIENFCSIILYNIMGDKFIKVRPKWLINSKTNKLLELDLCNNKLKIYLEYQGVQHYIWPNYLKMTKKQFLEYRERDKLKKQICKKKGYIGIIIPFIIPNELICNYIKYYLKKKKIKMINKKYQYIWKTKFRLNFNFNSISECFQFSLNNFKYIKRTSKFNLRLIRYHITYNHQINPTQLEKYIKGKIKKIKYISILNINKKTYVMIILYCSYNINKYNMLDYNKYRSHILNIFAKNKFWRNLEKYHYILNKQFLYQ